MAGAQTALASNVDALWANPAGLAKEPRTELYLDAGTLDQSAIAVGKATASALGTAPGAAGWAAGPTRTHSRFGYGFYFHTPNWQSTSTRLDESRTLGGSGLPPATVGGVAYDTLFPDGIQRAEHGQGAARLSVVAPGFGLGVRIADWVRAGFGLRWERVSLQLNEAFSQDFSAQSTAGGANLLTGTSQSSAFYAGEANRVVTSIGLQLELARGLMLGLVSEQPSQPAGGTGQARLDRIDQLLVSQNGTALQQTSSVVHIRSDDTAFQLRSGGFLRVGLGLVFDTLVAELDVEQARPLPAYAVFPRLESQPPSTAAAQAGPLATRARAVTRYRIAAALVQGNQSSWMFGIASDPAAVSDSDPIFRKVDLVRLTTGYYVTRGALAGTVRVGYTTADAPAVRFTHLTDDDGSTKPVRITTWSIGLSGSYAY
jgi:hypothetical protein